jgi:hypothetical protein
VRPFFVALSVGDPIVTHALVTEPIDGLSIKRSASSFIAALNIDSIQIDKPSGVSFSLRISV